MTKVIQISDTHLGRTKDHFAGNWAPLAAWIAQEAPALIVHSGDISVDGADIDDDFAYCRELMADLPAPLLVVPGNHDVGDPFSQWQPPTDERLTRWAGHYGADCWFDDRIEGWRLIGFDTMIMSSGSEAEEKQFAWLEEVMAGANGRKIAWFCHQPVFIESWDEGSRGYWNVKEAPRARLKAMADKYGLSLVGTGHVHLANHLQIGGTDFVWCPSAAFVCGPAHQEDLGGEKFLGAVRYDFTPEGVKIDIVKLPELKLMWIDDVAHEVYPPR